MDYVCKVVGNLIIPDINLELTYLEITDLYPDDFKASPRLREALRNKEIEVYNAQLHKGSKKIKTRFIAPPIQVIKENTNLDSLKEPITNITNKLDYLLSRIEALIAKNKENVNNSTNTDILSKILEQINKPKQDISDEKINLILNKFDELIEKGLSTNNKDYSQRNKEQDYKNDSVKEDIPIYIPKLDDLRVLEKNVQIDQETSEGTESILDKLRKLKGNI